MTVHVKVTVCTNEDDSPIRGIGVYCSDGRVRVQIEEFDGTLEIDPGSYGKNPRRLMYTDENGEYRWSKYILRSMLLSTKPVKLPGHKK